MDNSPECEGTGFPLSASPPSPPRRNDHPRYHSSRKYYNRYFDPIVSYGTIIFRYSEYGEIEFLIYQRRDTFEYMDFLRGAWSDESKLPDLFASMSISERNRIDKYTFQELWDDLILDHDCKLYKDGYVRAKRKFEAIK